LIDSFILLQLGVKSLGSLI